MHSLNIPLDSFNKGYNLDFTQYIEADYQGIMYVPWSNARVLLKQNFPNLAVGFDEPQYVENQLNMETKDILNNHYALEFEKIEKTTDSRAKKKLIAGTEDLLNILSYTTRGLLLQPYVYDKETGHRSEAFPFPVMDSTNKFIVCPDARVLSDSNMRAMVKAIACCTGIGLRLWSREKIDLGKKNDNNHPVYKGLVAINNRKIELLSEFGYLPAYWEDPDFGWSLHRLRAFNRRLKNFNGETIDEETGIEINESSVIIDKWRTPMQAVEWAIIQGLEKKDATALIKKAGNNKSFYDQVKEKLNAK